MYTRYVETLDSPFAIVLLTWRDSLGFDDLFTFKVTRGHVWLFKCVWRWCEWNSLFLLTDEVGVQSERVRSVCVNVEVQVSQKHRAWVQDV